MTGIASVNVVVKIPSHQIAAKFGERLRLENHACASSLKRKARDTTHARQVGSIKRTPPSIVSYRRRAASLIPKPDKSPQLSPSVIPLASRRHSNIIVAASKHTNHPLP